MQRQAVYHIASAIYHCKIRYNQLNELEFDKLFRQSRFPDELDALYNSRYFVMFCSDGNQQIEYGDFVIESNTYKKATKIYRI